MALTTTNIPSPYPFLQGGGELGELTRQHDWSQTTIGTPDTWPQSLRTTVGIILNSRFPMFLWWGQELIQFYNDAYRPSLGNQGKHPAVGKKGVDSWVEIWSIIKPMIDGVMAGGEATWHENQLIPIYRNGQLENVYWTFSYSPVLDEAGQPGGVLVTCQETTGVVAQTVEWQQNKQQLDHLFSQVNAGIAQTDTAGRFIDLNDRYCQMLGYARADLLQMSLAEVTHPDDVQEDGQLFARCVQEGADYLSTKRYIRKDGGIIWVNNGVSRVVTSDGRTLITAISIDMSATKVHEQQLIESENKLRSIIAAAPAGIGLFVGRDLIIEYPNQTFIDIVGKGPGVEGLPLREAMPELLTEGQPFLQILDEVFTSGEPFISPASLVQIVRNGVLNDNYYNISYTPIRNTQGAVYAILDIAIDVTEQVSMQQALQLSEARFQNLVRDANVGMIVLMGLDLRVTVINEAYGRLIGHRVDDLLNRPLFELIPAAEGYFRPLLEQVMASGEPFTQYETPYSVKSATGETIEGLIDYTYQPYREADGRITGVMAVVSDITEQGIARKKIIESETRFRTLAEQAPIFVFESDVDATVVYWNLRWLEFVGQTEPEALGRDGWPKVMHPDDYDQLLTTYISATAAKQSYEAQVRVRRKDGVYRTVLFTGKPRYAADGTFNGYIGNGIDISTQVENQLALAESEAKMRAILDHAHAAIGLYVGPDMIIENPNQLFIDILGKGPGIAGKPLREALPELVTEGQPFLAILDEVYRTGIGYSTTGTLIKIFRNGELTHNYYNLSYTPVLDPDGKTYEIVVVAIDVTEQIGIRHALEEKETTLRGAIDVAQMGTWELDIASGLTTYSDRLKELFEFNQDHIELDRLYNPILETDRARLVEAVTQAANPALEGFLDEEYTIITQRTGRHRIVRAQAKMYFDEQGQPTKLVGSMRDITQERQTQLLLEQLVQQRTEELAAANEELAATNEELEASNEEYTALNEELEESNSLLTRSNDDLQKFAYVASHDLQEPLRKIQQFGDLLRSRFTESSSDQQIYLERMQSAASRMSSLIRDLLDFSRVSNQREVNQPVPLTEVINRALATLELVIEESGATITVEPLPTIMGDASQLDQLFQNLLSNALKFRQPGQPPRIHLTSRLLEAAGLPPSVKPARIAPAYHQLDVADNGVGFDEKYLDRIFQVFQRLYGRNEYAGTGIGLAICEKVVANHGGAITASSQPGQGATFSVFFPIE